jgi:hypothetical protein
MFQFMSTCTTSKSNISSLKTTNGQLLVSLKLFKRSFTDVLNAALGKVD